MKTLKLSALAAFVLLFVSSCTRDTDLLTASSSSSGALMVNGKNANGEKGGGPVDATPAPAEGEDEEEDPNGLRPEMTLTYSANPATVNQPMTITASFLPAVTPPTCGKLVLEQEGDDPTTTEVETWFAVHEELVTAGDQTLTYTFTPAVAGDPAYTFRAHYKFNIGGGPSGKCAGYKNSHSEGFPLEVKEACDVNTLTVTSSAVAEDLKNGNYKFTVTYILKSPEAMENIHFQGGATSGGQEQHSLILADLKGLKVRNKNNQNNVLEWDGSLEPCEPVTLSFSYIRKFSCPEGNNTEVTGGWSVVGGGLTEPKLVDPVKFDCANVK